MNKKSGVADAAKEHMTTSQVLGPDESLPGTVSYDVPIDPDLLKLSPAAQDEVEVLLKQLLAISTSAARGRSSIPRPCW